MCIYIFFFFGIYVEFCMVLPFFHPKRLGLVNQNGVVVDMEFLVLNLFVSNIARLKRATWILVNRRFNTCLHEYILIYFDIYC